MGCTSCDSGSCVRDVPIFAGLPDREMRMLESIIESEYYPKGSLIFREGEQTASLFVVNNGLAKLVQSNKEGQQHILRFLFPGDYFGQFALLHNKVHYATAEVVESGYICRMRRDDFLPLLEQSSTLAFNFLMSVSKQLQQADEIAGALHIFETEKRLARLLLYIYSRKQTASGESAEANIIQLPAAKKEFAAMLGTTPETLSRKLKNLITRRVIEVRNRTVVILNMRALYQVADMAE